MFRCVLDVREFLRKTQHELCDKKNEFFQSCLKDNIYLEREYLIQGIKTTFLFGSMHFICENKYLLIFSQYI